MKDGELPVFALDDVVDWTLRDLILEAHNKGKYKVLLTPGNFPMNEFTRSHKERYEAAGCRFIAACSGGVTACMWGSLD